MGEAGVLAPYAAEDGVTWVAETDAEDEVAWVAETDAGDEVAWVPETDAEDEVAWVAETDAGDEVAWVPETDTEDEVAWIPETDAEEAAEHFCVVPFPAPLPPGTPGRIDDIVKLPPGGDRAKWIREATTRRVHGPFVTQRDRARVADREVSPEFVRIHALKLALEEPIEFCISWLLLAVRYTRRVRLAIHETKKVGSV